MNLSKRVCKHCITHSNWQWRSFNDAQWKAGFVECPLLLNLKVVVNSYPLNGCSYKLEHIVSIPQEIA